jgi:tetratricopeptide (TPR) repeat protein
MFIVRSRQRFSTTPVLVGAALFLFLFGGGSLHAEPAAWTSFRSGVRAYVARQYPAAINDLRKAIALNPTESREEVLIYGTWYEPYTPHLHLALALAQAGRCEEARAEFAVSDAQAVVPAVAKNIRDYGTMKAIRASCAAAPAPPPMLTATAPEKPQPRNTPPVTTSVATETRASQPVAAPPAAPQTATAQPGPSRDSLTASRRALQALLGDAARLLATGDGVTSPRARTARTKLAATLPSASKSLDAADAATIARAMASLTPLVNDYRNIVEDLTPPPSLAAAIRAYVSGDYQRTLALLSSVNTSNRSFRAQIALFRAAVHHSQFLLTGARDEALQQQAAKDVRLYRSIDPNGPINSRLFSPQFIAFANRNL